MLHQVVFEKLCNPAVGSALFVRSHLFINFSTIELHLASSYQVSSLSRKTKQDCDWLSLFTCECTHVCTVVNSHSKAQMPVLPFAEEAAPACCPAV